MNINEKFKMLRKEKAFADSYEYSYLKYEGDALVPDIEKNSTFGKTRSGFEEFKQIAENLDYPGIVSFRKYRDGVVLEKSIPVNNDYSLKAKKIYDDYLNFVVKELNIKDIDSFLIYLDENNFPMELDSIAFYEGKVSNLKDLVDRYNTDEDFKLFIDKIVA